MNVSPVPGLFVGFFDQAALFPPQSATMADAVAAYVRVRQSPCAVALGPFVCPAARVAGLAAVIDEQLVAQLPVALTFPNGLADDVESAVSIAMSVSRIRVAAVEIPLLDAAASEIAVVVKPHQTFVEVAVGDVTADVIAELKAHDLHLKLRTGGTVASAFPAERELATAITLAVRGGLPFKCTAGLHNAVRHRDEVTGFEHHGFLNVLTAAQVARTGGDVDAVAEALANPDRGVVAGRTVSMSPIEGRELRALFRSIGTCSVDEPLDDLRSLGIVR